MANTKMGVRPRRMQANYLDIGAGGLPDFKLMGTGFSDLNESPSAQTKSKLYVNMASSTQTVSGYEPKWGFTADQIRSEEVIEHICIVGEYRKTGTDAEADMVIVDLDKPAESGSTTKFKARKQRVAIAVTDFEANDGELACTGDLLGIGDLEAGVFDTSDRTFTADKANVTPNTPQEP